MIYLNGTGFDVEVDIMSRSYKKKMAYDVTTEDGLRHVKVKSTKLQLDLKLLTMEQDTYTTLLNIFKSTDSTLTVKIEDGINGDLEFTAINGDIYDECEFYDDNEVYWGSFSTTLEEQ